MARPSATAGGLLLSFAAALLVIPGVASAATPIAGGSIETDTTWTSSGSPYELNGDLTVAAGARLTLEAGVVVLAASADSLHGGADPQRVELIVHGQLLANGTGANPIVFAGQQSASDTWAGIELEADSGPSSLTFLRLNDCVSAISVRSVSPATVTDLDISSVGTGISWQSAAIAELERVSITGFTAAGVSLADDGSTGLAATLKQGLIQQGGPDAIGVTVAARVSAAITRTVVVASGTGVVADAGSSVTLTNDLIVGNSLAGIFLTQAGQSTMSVVNDTVDQNGGIGVEVFADDPSKVVIRNDIVTSNLVGVQAIGAQPTLDSCDVWDNTKTDLSGVSSDSRSFAQNPQFLSPLLASTPIPASYDYHLNATSPCIGAGDSSGAPTDDLDGFPRSSGGFGQGSVGVDLGAYQHQGGGAPSQQGSPSTDTGSDGLGSVIDIPIDISDPGTSDGTDTPGPNDPTASDPGSDSTDPGVSDPGVSDSAGSTDTGCGGSSSSGSDTGCGGSTDTGSDSSGSGCSGSSEGDSSGCGSDGSGMDCSGGADGGASCATAGRATWLVLTGLIAKRRRRRRPDGPAGD